MAEYLLSKFDRESTYWWFVLCLTGGGLRRSDHESKSVGDVLIASGLLSKGEENRYENSGQFQEAWGYAMVSGFANIRDKIDRVLKWG